jgi:hypothetical protein
MINVKNYGFGSFLGIPEALEVSGLLSRADLGQKFSLSYFTKT